MYVLFDIGGTKTRVASTENLEEIFEVRKFDTPKDYREGIKVLRDVIREVSAGKKINAIAGGIRGVLNREKTGIINDSKLTDWVGRNLVGDLEKHFTVPVYIENDSAIVGLGEVWYGAGKGYEIVAYHTVSTGVGGARYVNGTLDEASTGFEPGKQVVDIDRTILGNEVKPTLENLISGASLEERRGVKPYEIPQSDHVWDQLAGYFARGLKNTIAYWSPDAIVLGGSMIVGDPRILLEDIKKHTEEVLDGELACPAILDATLKDEGGLYGAMALHKSKLDNKN